MYAVGLRSRYTFSIPAGYFLPWGNEGPTNNTEERGIYLGSRYRGGGGTPGRPLPP